MHVKADPGGFPQRKVNEVPAVAATQMRAIQKAAQEDFSVDILQITENAGRAAAEVALAMLGGRGRDHRVIVLAGGGNKGSAGLCMIRHLVNWRCLVEPVLGEVENEMSFAAQRQLQILRASGIVEPRDQETMEITLEEHLARADLVVDALIGYGLEGPPTGIAGAITQLAVASKKPILALDIPSGVNATSGEVSSPAIRATTTLMWDLPKRGALASSARAHVGELFLADVGIPRTVHERLGIAVGYLFADGPIVRIRR